MIFKYFLLGSLSGFFSSTPLGPINLWVADHQLSKSPRPHLISFLTAVMLVDMIFAGTALWGHFDFINDSFEVRLTGILSGIFTVGLGINLVLKARLPLKIKHENKPLAHWKSFIQGLILTGMNPAFIIFWFFVANQIIANMDRTLSYLELSLFTIGVIIGDIIWFTLFGWILTHVEKKSQDKTLKRIRLSVGIIFITLGITGIGSYVFK